MRSQEVSVLEVMEVQRLRRERLREEAHRGAAETVHSRDGRDLGSAVGEPRRASAGPTQQLSAQQREFSQAQLRHGARLTKRAPAAEAPGIAAGVPDGVPPRGRRAGLRAAAGDDSSG